MIPRITGRATRWSRFADASPWIAWVPTVTAQSGTFTTIGTVTARYKKMGKTVFFYVAVPITTVGSATGYVQVTMPFTAANTAHQPATGRENGSTGKALAARILVNTANLQATMYDPATALCVSGYEVGLSGQYEIA